MRTPTTPINTQVDNAGIDVRLTQLRNLLAGHAAAATPHQLSGTRHRPATRRRQHRRRLVAWPSRDRYRLLPAQRHRGRCRHSSPRTDIQRHHSVRQRTTPPVAGRWGEPRPSRGSRSPTLPQHPGSAYVNVVQTNYNNPVRPVIRSTSATSSITSTRLSPRRGRRQLQLVRSLPASATTGEIGDSTTTTPRRTPAAGRADAAVRDPGRHQRHRACARGRDGTARPRADAFGRVEFTSYFRPPGYRRVSDQLRLRRHGRADAARPLSAPGRSTSDGRRPATDLLHDGTLLARGPNARRDRPTCPT